MLVGHGFGNDPDKVQHACDNAADCESGSDRKSAQVKNTENKRYINHILTFSRLTRFPASPIVIIL